MTEWEKAQAGYLYRLTNALFEYKNGVRATLTCGMILTTEQDQSIARTIDRILKEIGY